MLIAQTLSERKLRIQKRTLTQTTCLSGVCETWLNETDDILSYDAGLLPLVPVVRLERFEKQPRMSNAFELEKFKVR